MRAHLPTTLLSLLAALVALTGAEPAAAEPAEPAAAADPALHFGVGLFGFVLPSVDTAGLGAEVALAYDAGSWGVLANVRAGSDPLWFIRPGAFAQASLGGRAFFGGPDALFAGAGFDVTVAEVKREDTGVEADLIPGAYAEVGYAWGRDDGPFAITLRASAPFAEWQGWDDRYDDDTSRSEYVVPLTATTTWFW